MRWHGLTLVAVLALTPGESVAGTDDSSKTDVVAVWTETELQVSNSTDVERDIVVEFRLRRGAEDFYWTDALTLSPGATSSIEVAWPRLEIADSKLLLPATVTGVVFLTDTDGRSIGVRPIPRSLVDLSSDRPTLHAMTDFVALMPSDTVESMPPLADDEILTGIDDPSVFGAVNTRPMAGAAAEATDPPNEVEE